MIVDLAIVGFVGSFVWRGLHRGLLLSLIRFVGFTVASLVAVAGYRAVAPVVRAAGVSEGMANILAAVGLFVGVLVAAWVGGRALTRLLDWTKWGMLNKAGGAALAGAWSLSIVTVVVFTMSVMPAEGPRDLVDSSALASGIVREAPGFVSTLAQADLRLLIDSFNPKPEVMVAATTDFRRYGEGERALLDKLNHERARRGLSSLRWDDDLAVVARAHAADMYRRGYFSHTSPEGVTPAGRLRAREVRFRLSGENLALAGSVDAVHAELMGSERHRRHILDARYTRVGIGVMYGRQGLLVAQEFAA